MACCLQCTNEETKTTCSAISGQCDLHSNIELSHVRLAFFPPRTTSVTQTIYQAVIPYMKTNYRSFIMQSLLAKMKYASSLSELTKSIHVLDAVLWLLKAWKKVDNETITLCLGKVNFPEEISSMEELVNHEIDNLQNTLDAAKVGLKAVHFVTVDDELATVAPHENENCIKTAIPGQLNNEISSDEEE